MASRILAIDTSTSRGEVAVWVDGKTKYLAAFESERSHNSQMFAPLRAALDAAGDQLELIVVGAGPGSYTGVRIGIAAAQGIAWSKQVPVISLCSLLAPGAETSMQSFVLCGDARRGQFYYVQVKDGQLLNEAGEPGHDIHIPSVSPEVIRQRRDSEPLSSLPWYSFDNKTPADLRDITLVKPSAVKLAELAAQLSPTQVQTLEQTPLEPIYLSAPFVTQKVK